MDTDTPSQLLTVLSSVADSFTASTATSTVATATATAILHTATALATAVTNASATSSRPSFVLNYAKIVRWSSVEAAYIFMAVALLMGLATLRNLIYGAKSNHTKFIYAVLMAWCVFRTAGFAVRGYILTDDRGQDVTLYKWAAILGNVGFMPLAQVLAFCSLEGTALAYGFLQKTMKRSDLLVRLLFGIFGGTVMAFAIDYTCNKPFGSNVKDYTVDLVLREIGFNGLILITVVSLLGSVANIRAVVPQGNVPTVFVPRFRMMMIVVCVQSVLMLIKLVFTTYRNWNPFELRDEVIWYVLSIAPEYLFMLCYMNHGFLKVYDDIERYTINLEEEAKAKEAPEDSEEAVTHAEDVAAVV
ncbi:hypothetical protein BJ741DRAFT_602400 [Chytriomyces cf. hyalinus JEL632]|nr:hypothetical protein BJ741DRAFT_602400 [Chytriomyces cf. hyalinus JEL632]